MHILQLPPRILRLRSWNDHRSCQPSNHIGNMEDHDTWLAVQLPSPPKEVEELKESCSSSYFPYMAIGFSIMLEQEVA